MAMLNNQMVNHNVNDVYHQHGPFDQSEVFKYSEATIRVTLGMFFLFMALGVNSSQSLGSYPFIVCFLGITTLWLWIHYNSRTQLVNPPFGCRNN